MTNTIIPAAAGFYALKAVWCDFDNDCIINAQRQTEAA